MKVDTVVYKNQKRLRCGYTTGSCAAAAAKAALQKLFTGEDVREVRLMTPKGIKLFLEVEDCIGEGDSVSCSIRKNSGDDPDVTNGILIYATVSKCQEPGIHIDGGPGVGRITKKGLRQNIGDAAINTVPRKMLEEETRKLCTCYGYEGGITIIISIPEGERLAQETFNPRLGIIGGLSVLGTTGIVEPMSERALTETIFLELKIQKENGADYCCIVPGNYGSDFLLQILHYDITKAVKCSNYVGETIDFAQQLGFKGILFVGHVGKFIKLAAGIMNTHSRQADARMEILSAHGAMHGAQKEQVQSLMDAVTTAEALDLLRQYGLKEAVMGSIMKRIDFHMKYRAGKLMKIGVIMFSEEGILGMTQQAEELQQMIESGKREF